MKMKINYTFKMTETERETLKVFDKQLEAVSKQLESLNKQNEKNKKERELLNETNKTAYNKKRG